jgi:ketosteroid isomerase-like protein
MAEGRKLPTANLDLVRSIYAGWERGDFSSNDWAHADVEFVFSSGPEPGTWSGHSGMAEGYGDWLRAWENFRAEPEEYLELDDERILVLVRNSGRGKISGLEIESRSVANLFHLRDGKVFRITVYLDRDHAFADVGIPTEPDSQP